MIVVCNIEHLKNLAGSGRRFFVGETKSTDTTKEIAFEEDVNDFEVWNWDTMSFTKGISTIKSALKKKLLFTENYKI